MKRFLYVGPTLNDKIFTLTPLVVGPLSILGSCAILYNVLSDPKRRVTTPYYRIILALSIINIIHAITRMFSSFAIPKGTPGYYYAAGNQATCDAQGFFLQLSIAQPLYTTSLCIYFLLVIKYNKSDKSISNKIEPWMHIVSIGYPLITAVISIPLELFNPSLLGCYFVDYPEGCSRTDKTKCLRGHQVSFFIWMFVGVVVLICLFVVSWTMTSIVLYVRKREQIMNGRFSFGPHDRTQSKRLQQQKVDVIRQALLFEGTFVFAWCFGFVSRLLSMYVGKTLWGLFAVHQAMNQLQGFFTFIIYFWPRFQKTKLENKDKSWFWLLKDTITVRSREKVQRRTSAPRILIP